ncbi:MAG: hypothetical protein VB095_02730 [Anaerovorax sp.]|nr:hypothetical protein [Anaerovorax sp.]
MAIAGNSYMKELKASHLGWGDYRYTDSRPVVYGEAYIPIPKHCAINYSIFNSNHYPEGLGNNIFYAYSKDGYFNKVELLAQGCSRAGDKYAKQFSVRGDLKALGGWFQYRNAQIGSKVTVTWISPTEIELDII